MKRVAIVVEGDTEVEFVKQVLGPHLEAHRVITVAMKPGGLGGNISVDRLAPVMASSRGTSTRSRRWSTSTASKASYPASPQQT